MHKEDAITSIVDVSILPKAIGGDKVSEHKGEEDEAYCRGVGHPGVRDFCKGLLLDKFGDASTTSSSADISPKVRAQRPSWIQDEAVDEDGRHAFEIVESI